MKLHPVVPVLQDSQSGDVFGQSLQIHRLDLQTVDFVECFLYQLLAGLCRHFAIGFVLIIVRLRELWNRELQLVSSVRKY